MCDQELYIFKMLFYTIYIIKEGSKTKNDVFQKKWLKVLFDKHAVKECTRFFNK